MRGGAFLNGKEGRVGFRKNPSFLVFMLRLWEYNLREIRARCKISTKSLVVSQKTLIFAGKKGDTIMNTIAIDSNIYKGAESYAKLHNRDALSYVKTLKAKGGKPIPADENSLDALVEKKYALL